MKQSLLAEGVTVHSCPGLPDAFQIADFDYLGALKSFREGLFYVQDASSMLAAKAACPKEHDFVLDVCAAPGGKAIHIAQLMHGTGRVLARDLTEYKVWLLRDNISRCNVSNMEAQIWDATIVDKSLLGKADIVVADVPCSGLGVMRRKKDIRYKMTAEKLPELARLQRRILAAASQYVKAGGRLVYSTCTIHKGENEENASWFAKEFADFMLTESRQILPGETSGDGFYIAVFEKKGGRQRNGND